ncbi:MAG TPA: class I SAM-dependent methyltransferase [Acetobacteraceae bacterium]|jgi:ubiquinone/menaquinone biosynthesis C-methylase UbiE
MPTGSLDESVTLRQDREREYHRTLALRLAAAADVAPSMDLVSDSERRWWNSHWCLYDILLRHDLKGKRVLIAGCGLGDDACRLARMGASVYAFDISPDMVGLARTRAERFGFMPIQFDVAGAERTNYEAKFFDAALFHGVFHHIAIEPALNELDRIMKPDGWLFAHEQYTHSVLERPRQSKFVQQVIYPRLRSVIYAGTPYITEDEAKLNQTQFATIISRLADPEISYFNSAAGRLFPGRIDWAARLDRRLTAALGPLGRYTAGQIVFAGRWRQAPYASG